MSNRQRLCSLSLIVLASSLSLVSESFAQRGGPFGRGGSSIELLFQDDVKREIELVDEQEEQIRELGSAMRDSMRSIFGEIRDLPQEERLAAMMARIQEEQQKAEGELKNILLDHQLDRLKQLQFQSRIQRRGATEAIQSDEIREKLNLTEDQIERMETEAEKAQTELREKIQQATNEAREKVLAVLTPDQRAIWDELAGQNFSFQNRFRRGRGDRERRDRGRRRQDSGESP